ncbi:MAG: hypothetical protein P9F19_01205 [Candidatus Contendobacter sp.]|nr:hypothetical protein [Candidatus Contendobacter sp.]MDG4556006.1 hypothetical protein [Candidatus Contendobacter sp.]
MSALPQQQSVDTVAPSRSNDENENTPRKTLFRLAPLYLTLSLTAFDTANAATRPDFYAVFNPATAEMQGQMIGFFNSKGAELEILYHPVIAD